MARGFPSMAALLGLVALAGYQNRDKLGDLLAGAGTGAGADPRLDRGQMAQGGPMDNQRGPIAEQSGQMGGLGGLLGGLAGTASAGAGSIGGILSGGLGELMERFRDAGHGETAESWVGPGSNRPVQPRDLGQAIGPETMAMLVQQTGLTQEELLNASPATCPTRSTA